MATTATSWIGPATSRRRPSRGRLGRPAPTPLTSLSARLRGPWLDRELAAGAEPWRTPVHSARSLQITSRRGRDVLAATLRRLVRRAAEQPPAPGRLSAAVPLDRAAVLGAAPQFHAIASRLADGDPVATGAVAALRELLRDGTGPLYDERGDGILIGRLATIRDCLDVRE